jgi:SAM-dependent methyltransferase
MAAERSEEKAITLGHPSYVWRFGQDRRLELMRRHAPLEGRRILDVGCGLGMYVRRFRAFSADVHGVDVDPDKVAEAARELPNLQVAPAETLPFADGRFDVVLLHEVLEHVTDDRRALAEALRVTGAGGRVLIFVPNRGYPFETHGWYWRGQYRFGNIPLINYLPDRLRNGLAPHVRVYTSGDLWRLAGGLPCRIVHHTQIYPGFDNIVARRPRLGSALRRVAYALERTPLRAFGLSHFVVLEKIL